MMDHFKSAPSNDPCTKCPQGNRDIDNKTTCTCKDEKYPTRGVYTRCFGKLSFKMSYQYNIIESQNLI